MMLNSNISGRRVHISGSVSQKSEIASAKEVRKIREFLVEFVKILVSRGANFVIPIDKEPTRDCDNMPICFDWLIWKTLEENIDSRPSEVPGPFVYGVMHEKNYCQIPSQYKKTFENFIQQSDNVAIRNVFDWNMGSIRMEEQERVGDILITLGGSEGVEFLANKYYSHGKPVVPLNAKICESNVGARKIYKLSSVRNTGIELFQTTDNNIPHYWISKLNFQTNWSITNNSEILIKLLESLEKPTAFAIRLLSEKHRHIDEVKRYFRYVVKPVIENKFSYELVTIDNDHKHKKAHINREIFDQLRRSSLVIADLTGSRQNCFLELGFAFGLEIPTIIMAKKGTKLPFDILTVNTHYWRLEKGEYESARKLLFKHWETVRNRAFIAPQELLIP